MNSVVVSARIDSDLKDWIEDHCGTSVSSAIRVCLEERRRDRHLQSSSDLGDRLRFAAKRIDSASDGNSVDPETALDVCRTLSELMRDLIESSAPARRRG